MLKQRLRGVGWANSHHWCHGTFTPPRFFINIQQNSRRHPLKCLLNWDHCHHNTSGAARWSRSQVSADVSQCGGGEKTTSLVTEQEEKYNPDYFSPSLPPVEPCDVQDMKCFINTVRCSSISSLIAEAWSVHTLAVIKGWLIMHDQLGIVRPDVAEDALLLLSLQTSLLNFNPLVSLCRNHSSVIALQFPRRRDSNYGRISWSL